LVRKKCKRKKTPRGTHAKKNQVKPLHSKNLESKKPSRRSRGGGDHQHHPERKKKSQQGGEGEKTGGPIY